MPKFQTSAFIHSIRTGSIKTQNVCHNDFYTLLFFQGADRREMPWIQSHHSFPHVRSCVVVVLRLGFHKSLERLVGSY